MGNQISCCKFWNSKNFQEYRPILDKYWIQLVVKSTHDLPRELIDYGHLIVTVPVGRVSYETWAIEFSSETCEEKSAWLFTGKTHHRSLEITLTTNRDKDKQRRICFEEGTIPIHFADDIQFSIEITKIDGIKLADSSHLCEKEDTFVNVRKRFVLRKMTDDKLIGGLTIEEVPNIAIMGSGGGMRAVVGMGGAMLALQKTHILDYSTYAAGLSGSAWYLLTLYATDTKLKPKDVNDKIKEKLLKNKHIYFRFIFSLLSYIIKSIVCDEGYCFTFANIFGGIIGDILLTEGCITKWSQRVDNALEHGEIPLPLTAALHVRDEKTLDIYHEWIEYSPYQACIPSYGVSIDMKKFGDKFRKGFCTDKYEEKTIPFLLGICGSAYSIVRDLRPDGRRLYDSGWHMAGGYYLVRRFWSFFNVFDSFFIAKVPNFLRGITLERTERQPERYVEYRNLYQPEKVSKARYCFRVFCFICECGLFSISFYPGILLHFLCLTTEPSEDKGVTEDKTMMLIDAGLAFNSPYPLVLHPSRKVDVILSFDFTYRHKDENKPFKQLKLAEKWAKERGIPFPQLNIQEKEKEWESGKRSAVYIFSDQDSPFAPTIIHFVMIDTSDESKTNLHSKYSTFKFRYSSEEFELLNSLIESNMEKNKSLILQSIVEKIQQNRRALQKIKGRQSEPKHYQIHVTPHW